MLKIHQIFPNQTLFTLILHIDPFVDEKYGRWVDEQVFALVVYELFELRLLFWSVGVVEWVDFAFEVEEFDIGEIDFFDFWD